MSGAAIDGARAAEILRGLLPYVRGRSPLYERLIAGLAGAAERGFDGGVVSRVLLARGPEHSQEARLLLLAALHHAALSDPDLPHAAWFPTAVDDPRDPDDGAPGALALAHLLEHEKAVRDFVATHRLQTNEIGRCAALLPGMLAAASFGLPLRLLELGCSAGLNLRFDRYRYHYLGGPRWGPSGGPLLEARAEGSVPTALAPPTVEVITRRGVDLHPIDLHRDDDVRLLHSFAWPDERDRHARLREAITVGRATPATLDSGDLITWADEHAVPEDGTTTVLFHSQVRHLLSPTQLAALGGVLEDALRRGLADAPIVSLSYEAPRSLDHDPSPDRDTAPVHPELTIGIGDGDGPPRWHTPVAGDWHGRWVRWL